ncbi:MAG: hypothetical protein SwBeaBPW_36320 [Shewanella algae]
MADTALSSPNFYKEWYERASVTPTTTETALKRVAPRLHKGGHQGKEDPHGWLVLKICARECLPDEPQAMTETKNARDCGRLRLTR